MIRHIAISGLWGLYKIGWTLHPDINILVGINGGGKSTLLRILGAALSPAEGEPNKLDHLFPADYSVVVEGDNLRYSFARGQADACTGGSRVDMVNTFDEVTHEKKAMQGELSPLAAQLNAAIFDTRRSSLNAYRLKATESPEAAVRVSDLLQKWMEVVNSFFAATHKTLVVQGSDVFFKLATGETLTLTQLSAGEKQLLVILTNALTQDQQPFTLLMDEPEISLDIDWQYQLLEAIRKLNPYCQLVVATHSPAIFGNGWSDKIFYIDELFQLL